MKLNADVLNSRRTKHQPTELKSLVCGFPVLTDSSQGVPVWKWDRRQRKWKRHGKQTQPFPSHSLHTLWCIMKQSRRSHIKVARSSPLSSLSLSLLSNNDPIMSSHYSDSALLLKQVILYLQLDSLLLVWLIHTPFLSPCLALGRKETEKRDLPHGR